MMYKEFLEGTGCRQTDHNYEVYKRVEAIYSADEKMTKEEAYKIADLWIDNSLTEEEEEFNRTLTESIKENEEYIERYKQWIKEEQEEIKDLKERIRGHKAMMEGFKADIEAAMRQVQWCKDQMIV